MFGLNDRQLCDYIMDYVNYNGPREERNYNGAEARIIQIGKINPRNIEIYRLRVINKWTFNKIGIKYNLSGDRVRQIVLRVDRHIIHRSTKTMITIGITPDDNVIDTLFYDVLESKMPELLHKCGNNIDSLGLTLDSDWRSLPLSNNAYNCICRFIKCSSQQTIGGIVELLQKSGPDWYLGVYRCGVGTRKEIEDTFSRCGFPIVYEDNI